MHIEEPDEQDSRDPRHEPPAWVLIALLIGLAAVLTIAHTIYR